MKNERVMTKQYLFLQLNLNHTGSMKRFLLPSIWKEKRSGDLAPFRLSPSSIRSSVGFSSTAGSGGLKHYLRNKDPLRTDGEQSPSVDSPMPEAAAAWLPHRRALIP
nr:hypothetical protein Itr_chr09CG13880 [Ipomoea trifida]